MVQTGLDAWNALPPEGRRMAEDGAYDAFLVGFAAGWQAQENRPYFCAFCSSECQGETNAQTLAMVRRHVRECERHPLAIENRQLRAALGR